MPAVVVSRFSVTGCPERDGARFAALLAEELSTRSWIRRPTVLWDSLHRRHIVEFGFEIDAGGTRELVELVQHRELRSTLRKAFPAAQQQFAVHPDDTWIDAAA